MGEIYEQEDAVDEGVAQRDEGVETPPLQGVQNILNNEIH
jgi:hypothetical protein